MGVKSSKNEWIGVAVITATHAVFFIGATFFKRIYMGDSFEYIYEAINIREQGWFYSGNPALPVRMEYLTQRQPLYPLFLVCCYFFSLSNWWVIVLQNLISIFNVWYCSRFISAISPNKVASRWYLLFVCLMPSQFINANTIAPDILLQTFTVLYFVSGYRLITNPQMKHAVYMAIWLVLGMMVKPVMYPFVLVHAALLFIFMLRQQRARKWILGSIVLPILVVIGYGYHNYLCTGKFHYSSNQAFNAVYYYKPYVAKMYGVDSATRFLSTERFKIAQLGSYPAQYDFANQRGLQLFQQHFPGYLVYHLLSAMRMCFDPGKAEMDLFTGKLTYGSLYSGREEGLRYAIRGGWDSVFPYLARNPSIWLALVVLVVNVARFLLLIYFFTLRSVNGYLRIFVAVLIGYFSVAAGPIGNTRYLLPVSLILIACAATGAGQIHKRLFISNTDLKRNSN